MTQPTPDRQDLRPAALAPDGATPFAYAYGVRSGTIVWIAGAATLVSVAVLKR
jgi:hypothetical protein